MTFYLLDINYIIITIVTAVVKSAVHSGCPTELPLLQLSSRERSR